LQHLPAVASQDIEASSATAVAAACHNDNALMFEIEYSARGFSAGRRPCHGFQDAFKTSADAAAATLCALLGELQFNRFSILLNGRPQRLEKWIGKEAKFPEPAPELSEGQNLHAPSSVEPPASRYPRVGVFEVTVYDPRRQVHKVIFSKYKTRHLPRSAPELLGPLFPFLLVFAAASNDEDLLQQISMAAHNYDLVVPVAVKDLLPAKGASELVDELIAALEELVVSLHSGDPEIIAEAIRSIPYGLHTTEVDVAGEEVDRLEMLEGPISDALSELDGNPSGASSSTSEGPLGMLRQAVAIAECEGLHGEVYEQGKRRIAMADGMTESFLQDAAPTSPASSSGSPRDRYGDKRSALKEHQRSKAKPPMMPVQDNMDAQLLALRQRVVEAAATLPVPLQLQQLVESAQDSLGHAPSRPETLASLQSCLEMLLGHVAASMHDAGAGAASEATPEQAPGRELLDEAISDIDRTPEWVELDPLKQVARDIAVREMSKAVASVAGATQSKEPLRHSRSFHVAGDMDEQAAVQEAQAELQRYLLGQGPGSLPVARRLEMDEDEDVGVPLWHVHRRSPEMEERRRKELPPLLPQMPYIPSYMWEPDEEEEFMPRVRPATPGPYDEAIPVQDELDGDDEMEEVAPAMAASSSEVAAAPGPTGTDEGSSLEASPVGVESAWSVVGQEGLGEDLQAEDLQAAAETGSVSTYCFSSSGSSAAPLTSPIFSIASSPTCGRSRRESRTLLGFGIPADGPTGWSGSTSSLSPTLQAAQTPCPVHTGYSQVSPEALNLSLQSAGLLELPMTWEAVALDVDDSSCPGADSPISAACQEAVQIWPTSDAASSAWASVQSNESTIGDDERWTRRVPPGASLAADGVIWGEAHEWPPSAALTAVVQGSRGWRRGSRSRLGCSEILSRRHSAPPRSQQVLRSASLPVIAAEPGPSLLQQSSRHIASWGALHSTGEELPGHCECELWNLHWMRHGLQ